MLQFPEGKTATAHRGGPGRLDETLRKLSELGFSGYIRVIGRGEETEGFIVLKEGKAALYVHRKKGGLAEIKGQGALKKIMEDASAIDSTIEVHTAVNVDAILSSATGKSASFAHRRSSRRAVLAWGKAAEREEEEERKAIRRRLEAIKEKGYHIDVEKVMDGSLAEVRKRLAAIERAVQTLEDARVRLETIRPHVDKKGAGEVEKMLKDIDRAGEVEKKMAALEKKAADILKAEEEKRLQQLEEDMRKRKVEKEAKQKAAQVYDLVLKHAEKMDMSTEKAAVGGEEKKDICPTCGSPLNEDGVCETCSKMVSPAETPIARLHSNYRFENFVVGASNHFAHAAAMAVAKSPATAYNPLFIWSEPGLGKTHLLNAIANYILEHNPNMRVIYVTTEQFTNDLIEALREGKLEDFRKRYRSADVLIVDDVQFLAGKDQTQEEFFHTFNALFTVDKQIVLASDRPPKEIPKLQQRLVSRFEGGLIVQIERPDYETRLAILKQKAAEKGIKVSEEVLDFIARSITTNIRELEGALNKVVAFSSFTGRKVDVALAREVLKDIIESAPPEAQKPAQVQTGPPGPQQSTPLPGAGVGAVVGPPSGVPGHAPPVGSGVGYSGTVPPEKVEIEPGRSYLVEESTLGPSMTILKRALESGRKGIVIVRTNPRRVEREHGITGVEMYWLTDRESRKTKTMEPSLEKMMYEISNFLEKNPSTVVFLDGIDYLTSMNSFDLVIHFIRRLVDTVAETDAILIVSLSPYTLQQQQVKILEREMEVLSYV